MKQNKKQEMMRIAFVAVIFTMVTKVMAQSVPENGGLAKEVGYADFSESVLDTTFTPNYQWPSQRANGN